MDTINISIARDYSPCPGPRYEKEGNWSGEVFRKTIFYPMVKDAINSDKIVKINLDGTAGYGTSFLEEIFGGLIRVHELDYKKVLKHLEIISEEEDYLKDDIYHYLQDAYEQKKLADKG